MSTGKWRPGGQQSCYHIEWVESERPCHARAKRHLYSKEELQRKLISDAALRTSLGWAVEFPDDESFTASKNGAARHYRIAVCNCPVSAAMENSFGAMKEE